MKPTKDKILPLNRAIEKVAEWKLTGQKIIFTNECFDLLQPGHIDCLEKARNLGHRLVVALNSDQSVSRLKGRSMKKKVGAGMLAALDFVDVVVLFEEDTPEKLIKMILPDILLKAGITKSATL